MEEIKMAASYSAGQFLRDTGEAIRAAAFVIQDISDRFNASYDLFAEMESKGNDYKKEFNTIRNDPGRGFFRKSKDIAQASAKTISDIGGLLDKYTSEIKKPFISAPQLFPSYNPSRPKDTASSQYKPNTAKPDSSYKAPPAPKIVSDDNVIKTERVQAPSKEDLEAMLKTICEPMKSYGNFSMEIEFKDYGMKARINHKAEEPTAYFAKKASPKPKNAARCAYEHLEDRLDAKDYAFAKTKSSGNSEKDYLYKSASLVGDLYNNGKNYKQIRRSALKQGICQELR